MSQSSAPVDALELLTGQHREAMDLFERIEKSEDPREGRRLFEQLKRDLQMHEDLEEKLLYPRLKQDEAFKDDTLEAYQEHHVMDLLLREITALSVGAEEFEPKVKVLKENVQHHAEEEEEGKLFPEIRKRWSAQQLSQLSVEMQGLLQQLKAA